MTDLRAAAQQALEALENAEDQLAKPYSTGATCAITALRAALAEPVQEPVAYSVGRTLHWHESRGISDVQLYATPPQRPAEPVQEPVAWIHTDPDKTRVKFLEWREDEPGYRGRWIKTPLYAVPPQRKPLTDEEIEEAYKQIWRHLPDDFDHTSSAWIEQGIRYAETAHGIKSKT